MRFISDLAGLNSVGIELHIIYPGPVMLPLTEKKDVT